VRAKIVIAASRWLRMLTVTAWSSPAASPSFEGMLDA
jgi:hypothetical protein